MIIEDEKTVFSIIGYNFEIIKCFYTNLILLMLDKNVIATIIEAIK